ncbi:hypothetical protein C8R48DRAFT_676376 [Suillus tomentosus]|nr:hypothetical protein C8R48DRAFT_676376 [Suillus tomentosus]
MHASAGMTERKCGWSDFMSNADNGSTPFAQGWSRYYVDARWYIGEYFYKDFGNNASLKHFVNFHFVLGERELYTFFQPETETSRSTYLAVDPDDIIMSESTYGFTLNEADSYLKIFNQLRRPIDLTTKVVAYATAQGSFGDVWKCIFSDKDINAEVGSG